MAILYHATLIHSTDQNDFQILRNALLAVSAQGIIEALIPDVLPTDIQNVVHSLPSVYAQLAPVRLRGFLIPGFVDTHIHAPQYQYMGSATDRPLMQWLTAYAFPAETRLEDVQLARLVYDRLVQLLLRNGTTTALYFATIHVESCKALADVAIARGQRAFIGKVSMDQHGGENYVETTEASLRDTEEFIQHIQTLQHPLIKPVVTPRFIPTCSLALLKGLGELARKYGCHIQSHIAESDDQIAFTNQLYENMGGDVAIFDSAGLLTSKAVMAHGTKLTAEELHTLRAKGTAIAHCPLSNFYFGDGIFALRSALTAHTHTPSSSTAHKEQPLKVGLGTDVAGGYSPSMLSSMRNCVIASLALATQRQDNNLKIDFREAFSLATIGGARALGVDDSIGSFAVGKQFDAIQVVWSTDGLDGMQVFGETEDIESVFEKFIHLGDDRNMASVWVQGRQCAGLPQVVPI
eukprot:GILK01012343.1.p1 GENE.GILK01012343.1~~GILK01012343.1.p1  ORF type:complete len:464 (-),score=36.64 GILK01012343.1:237-1628(-)